MGSEMCIRDRLLVHRRHAGYVSESNTDKPTHLPSVSGYFKSEHDFCVLRTQTRPRFILSSEGVGNRDEVSFPQ